MFHLFCGEDYYPGGGMTDYVGSYPTLAEAQNARRIHGRPYAVEPRAQHEWGQIAELIDGKLVETWENWGDGNGWMEVKRRDSRGGQ
jgi:hypothetical protein